MEKYYDRLGLKQDATVAEIIEAYRLHALEYSSKIEGGHVFYIEKLALAHEAYEMLMLGNDIPIVEAPSPPERVGAEAEGEAVSESKSREEVLHASGNSQSIGIVFILFGVCILIVLLFSRFIGE